MNYEDRFNEKWELDPETECWLWTGKLTDDGYGTFRIEDRTLGAHRAAHILFIGPVPKGWHVDHVYAWGCRYRHCVNWLNHLEAVTPAENHRRAIYVPKEFCVNSHPQDADSRYSNGVCKKCQIQMSLDYQRRKREEQ